MKIAFYKKRNKFPTDIISELIKWWDGGPYSHCELIFSSGVSASSSMQDNGVRFKHIEYGEHWDIIAVPEQFSEAYAYEWFVTNECAAYDFLGDVGFVLNRGIQDKNKWFCSEAIASALGFSDAWRLSPNGLYSIIQRINEIS
jgi:hypothetical protein